MTLRRPRLLLIGGAGALVVLGIALAAFQPWRLFTNTTVHEALPSSAVVPTGTPGSTSASPGSPSASPGSPSASRTAVAGPPVTLATGSFLTHEHHTSGRVRVLQLSDGSRVLRLEGLDTSDGPALHVWLSDQPVRAGRDGWGAFDDGAYLDLGDLKANHGDQNYPVPATADLQHLTSVSVWCARFHVSFGAAALAPVA